MVGFEWISLLQSVVTAVALILIWLLRRAFQGGAWTTDLMGRMLIIERTQEAQKERLDHAGAKLSDLASHVQGLPERLREQFLSLDRANDIITESRADRVRLWQAIDQLRTKP